MEGAARARILIIDLNSELLMSKTIHESVNMYEPTCVPILATARGSIKFPNESAERIRRIVNPPLQNRPRLLSVTSFTSLKAVEI